MENNELNSMIGGYISGKVISNNLNNEIKKQIDAIEEWKSHHPFPETINESLSKFILSKDFDGGYKTCRMNWLQLMLKNYVKQLAFLS